MHHSTVSIIMSTTCLNVVRISERQLFMNYIDALREASIKAPSHLIIHEVSSLIRIKYFLGTSLIIEIEFQIQILYLFIILRLTDFIYTYSIYICSLAFDMACILILMMSSSLRSTAVTVASTTTRNTSRPCTCLNGVIYTYRYEHGGCSRKIYFSTSTNYRYSRYKHINLRNDIEIKLY